MLKAKVADTPSSREHGLMFVDELESDRGMLFIFEKPQLLSFWGKNTFIPLDIAFVDASNRIKKIAKIEPHSVSPVKCEHKCLMAIEANVGYFSSNDIESGDSIRIDRASFRDDAEITFTKDSVAKSKNVKQSQVDDDLLVRPENEPVGDPIGENIQEVPEENLPIIDSSEIGEYLEDTFDEEPTDGLDGEIDETEQVEEQETEETEEYPVFSNVFEATEWAEKNNEVIRINYTTKRGRQIVRDVEPHGKFHSKSTMREILVTYDETISGIRAFILTNIGNWAFVGQKFQKKFVVKS